LGNTNRSNQMNQTRHSEAGPLHALLVCNGGPPSPQLFHAAIREQTIVIGVDGGATVALTYGVVPNIVIGDLDSLPVDIIKELESSGAVFIKHPSDKDYTDLELAVLHVLDMQVRSVTILGATGKDADHYFTNALLLTDERFHEMDITMADDNCTIGALQNNAPFGISKDLSGRTFSIIPISDEVLGVNILGAKWELTDATLLRGRSRTSRNQVLGEDVVISSKHGAALVITHNRS